jgi:hypothetical protein
MNCREFERGWNELLDIRSTGSTELERALEAHASACEPCRAVSARYQVLRQALSAWKSPPRPSARSIERLHDLTVPSASPGPSRRPSSARNWLGLASAAAVFALAWLGTTGWLSRTLPGRPAPDSVPSVAIASSRPLALALAEATEATIDLAREASAPVARIGREVLDLDNLAGSVTIERADVATIRAAPSSIPSDLLQSVGQRVNEGVKPISGSARHAFSFLLGPPPDPDPAPGEARDGL